MKFRQFRRLKVKLQLQNKSIEWKEVEFGNSEYFEVKKGESITKDKVTEGKIPVVAGGQQPAYYHNKSNRPGETITISGSGAYAGFVNYFKEPIFASDCSTVQIKNNLISSKYACLFLKSYQSKIYLMQKGIAQPHVYPKDIVKIKIPLPFFNEKPDLKEQERIVKILEKATKLKERGKNANDLLDEYLRGVFNEMFLNDGFPKEILNNNCDRICVSYVGPCDKYYTDSENGVPMIKTGNLKQNHLDLTKLSYVTKEFHKQNKKSQLSPGDLLIARHGTNGQAALVMENIKEANCLNVVIIRTNREKYIPLFLQFLFNSESTLNQISGKTGGSTQSVINTHAIQGLQLIRPPIPLQQKFAKIVEQVEKMKEKIKNTKQNSEELFSSLMQKAFRGEL